VNILIGAGIGAIAGIAIITANAFVHPDVNLTAGDFVAAAFVGGAAGVLISTGVGIGAGTALGAGTGAAGSAVGYTLAAGSEYNSDEMMVNAGIGAVAGAATGSIGQYTTSIGRVTAGKILQGGVSFISGEAQTIASNKFNGEGSPPYEILGGGNVGVAGTIMSEASRGVPLLGPVAPYVDDVIRSGVIEYFGNRAQKAIDKEYDTYHSHYRSRNLRYEEQ
jgi:hypothetical protein